MYVPMDVHFYHCIYGTEICKKHMPMPVVPFKGPQLVLKLALPPPTQTSRLPKAKSTGSNESRGSSEVSESRGVSTRQGTWEMAEEPEEPDWWRGVMGGIGGVLTDVYFFWCGRGGVHCFGGGFWICFRSP